MKTTMLGFVAAASAKPQWAVRHKERMRSRFIRFGVGLCLDLECACREEMNIASIAPLSLLERLQTIHFLAPLGGQILLLLRIGFEVE